MLTPQRRAEMDAVLGKTAPSTSVLTPQRRAEMDSVLGKNQKSVGGFVNNIAKSGVQAVKDIGGSIINVVNPDKEKNTVVNMWKLAQGAGQMLDPTKGNKIANFSNKATFYMMPWLAPMLNLKNENFEQYPKNVGTFYKDRYGSVDAIKNTVYNDPVGVGLDIATVATGVGGLAKGGAVAASKAGLGAGVASNMAKAGNTLTKAGMALDPIAMGAKGFSKVGGAVTSKVRPTLFNRADKMVTAGIGNPMQQYKIGQKGGRSVSSFIDEYNLYDRSPETAGQVVKDIGEKFDTSAMSTNKNIQVGQLVKSLDDEIAKLSQGAGGIIADATGQKIAELQRRRQMFLDSIVQNNEIDMPVRQPPTDPLEALKVEARKYKSADEMFHAENRAALNTFENDTLAHLKMAQFSSDEAKRLKTGSKHGYGQKEDSIINAIKTSKNDGIPVSYSSEIVEFSRAVSGYVPEGRKMQIVYFNTPYGQMSFHTDIPEQTLRSLGVPKDQIKFDGNLGGSSLVAQKISGDFGLLEKSYRADNRFSLMEKSWNNTNRRTNNATVYAEKIYTEKGLKGVIDAIEAIKVKLDAYSQYKSPASVEVRNAKARLKQLTDLYNQSQLPKSTQLNFTRTQAQSSPLQVPLKQITEFRRNVIDPDVPKSEFGLNPKETGKAGGVKATRDIFRRESIKVAPELKKLGLDYGMAKELEEILKKSDIRKSNRQLFNFTKMGGGGIGGLVAGAPGVIGGFLLEQIVNDPRFIKYASTGLKKALNAKLPQNKYTKAGTGITGGLYQTGRFGRLTGYQTQPRSTSTQTQPMLQLENLPYQDYTPKSDLLDEIAKKQGLDVNEMRKKRLNFRR